MSEQSIFFQALEIDNARQRAAFLDRACGDDQKLRQQVEALLAAHERSDEFLDVPALRQMAGDAEDGPDGAEAARGRALGKERELSFLQPSTARGSLGRLGHYEVREVIGRGGCGIVLRAFDTKLERIVAIKVMSPGLAATSPARKRFLREARATAAIRHENVVSIYAVEEQPLPFLVMECIDGETLQQRIDRTGPLDVPSVLRIGRQIASGLAAAHDQGLVHRDIKPANILLEVGSDLRLKITDFGLARSVDDASLTQSGVIAGTPLYMSPEQALASDIDYRSDLFSLGSVLYVMCSGRPPFRAPSTLAVMKRVVEDQPRPIEGIIPEVPKWLRAIIAKLHQKNPAERFASAREVADLFARCQSELEQFGRVELPDDILAKLPAGDVKGQAGDAGQFVARKAKRTAHPRRRTRSAAAAVALILVFIGLGMTEATGVTNVVRGPVIRLFSPAGVLVVEVEDPGVSVTLDGEELVIAGTGVREIRLKPGHYELKARKDGKVLRQELVTVTRDGRRVVRVSREGTAPRDDRNRGHGGPAEAPPPAVAPFEADEAKRFQQAWAEHLGVPVERQIVIGRDGEGRDVNLTMVLIPPGEFLMGASEQERTQFLDGYARANHDQWAASRIPSEGPPHRVRITSPFYLGKYEVTQAQWRAVMGDNPSNFDDAPENPVERLNWNDAQLFLVKLNSDDAARPLRFGLPTEAQWEFACRAGTTTIWSSGDDQAALRKYGWFHGHAGGRTHPVGQLEPNPFGLHDMHGNVWEWCRDWFADDYYGTSPEDDPSGPEAGLHRAIRGGCAMFHANYCRSASRDHNAPGHVFGGLGFRLAAGAVREPEPSHDRGQRRDNDLRVLPSTTESRRTSDLKDPP